MRNRNRTINLTPSEVKVYVKKLHDLTVVLGDVRKTIATQTANAEDGWNDDNYIALVEEIENNSVILDNIQARIFDFCSSTNCYADVVNEAREKHLKETKK